MDVKEFDMMLFLFLKLRKINSQNVKKPRRIWITKIFEKLFFLCRFFSLLPNRQGYFFTFSASNFSWLKESGGFLNVLIWFSFCGSILISILLNLSFKKYSFMQIFFTFSKTCQRKSPEAWNVTSPCCDIVLKSNFLDFKITITERWNKDKTTIRTIWRYLLMLTVTIAKDYPSYALS